MGPADGGAGDLTQLPGWFEDYNERHPYKGLMMKSPSEFIRSSATAGCPV